MIEKNWTGVLHLGTELEMNVKKIAKLRQSCDSFCVHNL